MYAKWYLFISFFHDRHYVPISLKSKYEYKPMSFILRSRVVTCYITRHVTLPSLGSKNPSEKKKIFRFFVRCRNANKLQCATCEVRTFHLCQSKSVCNEIARYEWGLPFTSQPVLKHPSVYVLPSLCNIRNKLFLYSGGVVIPSSNPQAGGSLFPPWGFSDVNLFTNLFFSQHCCYVWVETLEMKSFNVALSLRGVRAIATWSRAAGRWQTCALQT